MAKRILALALAVVLIALSGCSTSPQELQSIEKHSTSQFMIGGIPAGEEDADKDAPETPNDNSSPANTENPTPAVPEGSTFSILFMDVGQADAALVECDGQYLLIDGGNKEDSQLIYSVLSRMEVKHLSMVVGSHGHEDHIGGIPGCFAYATADKTLCPVTSFDSNAFEDFKEAADKNGGGITIPNVGDTYPLGSAIITILGVNSTEETNDTSIVLRIDYGDTSFLFTGDAEWDAEQTVLSSGVNLSATVLKVGHHGSASSTGYQFLRAIAPQYAVISVGTGNEYGHPTEEVLSRLRDADVTVFRTDMQGDIYCTSDGKKVSFAASRNMDADTLSEAGAGGNHDATPESQEETISSTEPADTAEPATTYVVNTNTGKFHYPSCSSVDQMSEKNKLEVTENRDTLVSQGYDPCGRCNP